MLVVASRRHCPNKNSDQVCFCLLWSHAKHVCRLPVDVAQLLRCSVKAVAARNVHILLPSLFNHHHSHFGQSVPSPWPLLDEQAFHAISPSTFSIVKTEVVRGENRVLNAAAGGVSPFVIAGQLAGVEIDDRPRRRAEPVSHVGWMTTVSQHATVLEQHAASSEEATEALAHASAVCDMLSGEGVVGLLAQKVLDGALPDLFHWPAGVPLLVAFACRLCCYPRRFGLTSPAPEDTWANRELISLFEAGWSSVSNSPDKPHNLLAVDIVLKAALKEASAHAKQSGVQTATHENLLFWQRAGQRCVTTLFGPQNDVKPLDVSPFGKSTRFCCPLAEARARVARESRFDVDDAEMPTAFSSLGLSTKRQTLLRLLDSVEMWMRTGSYCGLQVNKANKPARKLTKSQLEQQLEAGVERSVRELVGSGGQNEAEARTAAQLLKSGVAEMLAGLGDDENVDMETFGGQDCGLDDRAICIDAFKSAISCVSAAMCQGSAIHHQFRDFRVLLCWKGAKNLCADCNSEVHLLEASFLASEGGECSSCHRARCFKCAEIAREQQPATCLRCKLPAAKPTAPTKAGSSKKGRSRKA
jgi:hypothetical protein